jgi:hypothetical protein
MLADQVLCSLNADHFKLLSLVGHDLCLPISKIYNCEHFLGSLFDINRFTLSQLKSSQLNIGCNLLIDAWNLFKTNPLNLQDCHYSLSD